MSKDNRVPVQSTYRYNVPAEKIYDTLLDPKKARTFMFATIEGKMIKAEIDPKVGGEFVFIDRRESGDAPHYGKYLELSRPNRVVFEFAVQKNSPESDRVSIDIKTLQRGCEVTLTHDVKKEYAHLKERIQQGWDSILDGLGEALRG
ncbi:MAG TPA: SRPBCC family protein [Bdellovibrionales bacterium]|nr:SRPBCC family protein [Bdellovibrionales bacterium]